MIYEGERETFNGQSNSCLHKTLIRSFHTQNDISSQI